MTSDGLPGGLPGQGGDGDDDDRDLLLMACNVYNDMDGEDDFLPT